jgi:hypothetical protein
MWSASGYDGGTKSGVSTISLGTLQYILWVTAGRTQKTKTKTMCVNGWRGQAEDITAWAIILKQATVKLKDLTPMEEEEEEEEKKCLMIYIVRKHNLTS